MPGYLLTMKAQTLCMHGGQGKFMTPNPRVKIKGVPVPMPAVPATIAGCANPPPPANIGPCVTAVFLPPTFTLRVKSMGMGLLCMSSKSLCVPTPKPLDILDAGQTNVQGQ